MSRIRVIILTKSSMKNSYCVAGINCSDNQWVRLVSENGTCSPALSKKMLYSDVGIIYPLDIVEVHIKNNPQDYRFQKENRLLDEKYPIKKVGKISFKKFLNFHPPENHELIFGNNHGSIHSNHEKLASINYSLMFIKVDNLRIHGPMLRKIKLDFTYNNVEYHEFSLTDPGYKNYLQDSNYLKDAQNKILDSSYLVISFPEEKYSTYYYKFIAKIFQY
ncbi:MAG: conserved hypothetical protein [Methanobrevibacter sp. CfCl-M3]